MLVFRRRMMESKDTPPAAFVQGSKPSVKCMYALRGGLYLPDRLLGRHGVRVHVRLASHQTTGDEALNTVRIHTTLPLLCLVISKPDVVALICQLYQLIEDMQTCLVPHSYHIWANEI